MNKQTINNYTEKTKKGDYKGFIDESNTYKTLPEKDEYYSIPLKEFELDILLKRLKATHFINPKDKRIPIYKELETKLEFYKSIIEKIRS